MSELNLNKIDNLVGSYNSEIYIGYIKDEKEMNKNIFENFTPIFSIDMKENNVNKENIIK